MVESSCATGQRSLKDPRHTYPLAPPLTTGCPATSTDDHSYPVEVTYTYDDVDPTLFEEPPTHGLQRWAPLLPPLAGPGLEEGNTPVIADEGLGEWLGLDGPLWVKDESRNPTWSQKDRLNRCVLADAVRRDAAGIVVSSSGNHGASAAAYAARADLPCIVLTAPETPGAVMAFLERYGAAVLAVEDWIVRQQAVDAIADRWGFIAASSRTADHTGHPYGPEGYKTIAYELYHQLDGTVPGTIAVPTSFAEILFGIWKGYQELVTLGLTETTPQMVPCEPRARGPLATALSRNEEYVTVPPQETAAYSIRATQNSYRGVHTVTESNGYPATFTESHLSRAQRQLAETGLWQEASGAGGLAGLTAIAESDSRQLSEPVVCLGTSSGFKDGETATPTTVDPTVEAVLSTLTTDFDVAP